ncbi:MAG: ATP-binding protein, partial [Pseudonocardiaceae bacterium]
MGTPQYRPRVVDDQVTRHLAAMGAVVLEGPKACGKTETARQHAASEVRLDVDDTAAELARLDPGLVLDGATPRLIDEWNIEPRLWNAVRRAVDDRKQPGQFLLTGSATPGPDARRHSGAGRMAKVRMRPMSLWESGASTGQVSLAALIAGKPARGHSELAITDYASLITRGGWPEIIDASGGNAERYVRNYFAYAVEHAVPTVGGPRHDPIRLQRFLQAYARLSAQTAPLTTIASRAVGGDAPMGGRDKTLAWHTADAYRDTANRLMLIEDLPAWDPQLRSRTRLAGLPKRHLVDPSLAAALLGSNAERLLRDPQTLGYLFESLAARDVLVYAQASNAQVFHYRERDGELEADLIVENLDGTWLGIEVELGDCAVDDAATALRKVAERRIARPPQALVVITATEY